MKFFLLLFIITFLSCSSQKNMNPKKVSIIEMNKTSLYKVPKSILFIFTGDTHLINYYKDLAIKIRKDLYQKNISAFFNYNIKAEKPLQFDLDNIPKKIYNYQDYDVYSNLSVDFLEPKKYKSNRKIYDLIFDLKSSKEK